MLFLMMISPLVWNKRKAFRADAPYTLLAHSPPAFFMAGKKNLHGDTLPCVLPSYG
jgi:hypothetical protein